MKQTTVRLNPDEDLKKRIEEICQKNNIKAGVLISAVGSLKTANIRVADGKTEKRFKRNFEIVSLNGTVSVNGCHLHISLADQNTNVIGGHLKYGCSTKTTAELVFLIFNDVEYERVFDRRTGYDELSLKKR